MTDTRIVYLSTWLNARLAGQLNLPFSDAGLKKKRALMSLLDDAECMIFFVSMFSRFTWRLFRWPRTLIADEGELRIPLFSTFFPLNYLINPFATFVSLAREHRRQRIDFLVLYNATYETVLPALMLRTVARVAVVVQLEDGWFADRLSPRGLLHRFAFAMGRRLADGFIVNSRAFLPYLPDKPYFLFRGLYDESAAPAQAHEDSRVNIVFASSMDKVRGARLLVALLGELRSVSDIRERVAFDIIGGGDDAIVEEISSAASEYREAGGAATYHGRVSEETLESVFAGGDVFLALQDPSVNFSRVCFPSKIFDCYHRNRPIITTRVSDLEDSEFENLIFTDYSVEDLQDKIRQVVDDFENVQEKNSLNAIFLKSRFSRDRVGRALSEFLAALSP